MSDIVSRRVRRALISVLILWSAPPFATGQAPQPTAEKVHSLKLGNGGIDVVTTQFGDKRLLLCNVHDDEDTSVEAARRVLSKRSGRLIELRHTGQRNLTFHINNREYCCDPNRIFTAPGIRCTLEKLGAWDDASQTAVSKFAEELLRIYALYDASAVIALHNNTDQRYAATSYLPGAELAQDAAQVSLEAGADPDDFFFVTQEGLFQALKAAKFNVVLQDNRNVTDDGSLSVYCGQQGIPYVNVEAEHGHLEAQMEMLDAVFQVLLDLGILEPRHGDEAD